MPQYTVQSIYRVTDLPGQSGANIFLRSADDYGSGALLMIAPDPQLLKLVAGDTVTITVDCANESWSGVAR